MIAKIKKTPALQNSKIAKRDRIVLEHLPLVKAIAVRVHENLPVHVDLDDLVHAGVLGFSTPPPNSIPKNRWRFPATPSTASRARFWTACGSWIGPRAICAAVTSKWKPPRANCPPHCSARQPKRKWPQKLGVDVERWRQMMLDLRSVGLISASSRTAENEESARAGFPEQARNSARQHVRREQMRSVFSVAMKTLPERYQKVVFLYYTNEMTMKEIGGVLGINESRVSQIHKSALEKMQVVLQSNGISSSCAF